MKKLAIISTFISVLSLNNAYAADGMISFTGKITATACKVNTSGGNSVPMGSISTTAFAPGAGVTAAAKAFNIVLKECPSDSTTVNVRFDGTRDTSNSNILALTPGTDVASNVGIALYESDGSTLIPLNADSAQKTLVSGDNTLPYVAKYMSTASTVGAGKADAVAYFTIIYP